MKILEGATLSFKDLCSRGSEELGLLDHLFIDICDLSSDVDVVLVIDAEILQIDGLVLRRWASFCRSKGYVRLKRRPLHDDI